MARIENKCTNCRLWKKKDCQLSKKMQVLVFRHCDKFKPKADILRGRA